MRNSESVKILACHVSCLVANVVMTVIQFILVSKTFENEHLKIDCQPFKMIENHFDIPVNRNRKMSIVNTITPLRPSRKLSILTQMKTEKHILFSILSKSLFTRAEYQHLPSYTLLIFGNTLTGTYTRFHQGKRFI